MLNELLLLSKNDIPFIPAQISIHQPTLKEIAYIGEEAFYSGCEMLQFSKDNLKEEDRINLEQYTNFDILMSMINMKDISIQKNKTCMLMVLSLIFPEYRITFNKHAIVLSKGEKDNLEEHILDNSNFEQFKEIVVQMFCLNFGQEDSDYNPGGALSKKIAEKLKQRKNKLMEQKGDQKISILSRYMSILAVGQQKDMNDYLNYSVYQLFEEFTRYELKINYDLYFQAKLAGAQDLKEAEDWMKDIHS